MITRYNWNKPRYVKLRLDHLVMISTNGFGVSYNWFKYSVSNKNFTLTTFKGDFLVNNFNKINLCLNR